MYYIILGKPLVFWFGIVALSSFLYQLYLGYGLTHGHPEYFERHRMNALILTLIVMTHLILGLLLYL